MKMSKRFAALLTAGLLVMTPCVTVGMTAFAGADDTYTITVDGDNTGYTYTAYQILTGEVTDKSGTKVLSDIAFAPAIEANKAAFLEALAGSALLKTGSAADFNASMTAQDVANVLEGYQTSADKDTKLAEFARIAKAYVSSTAEPAASPITVTGSGYYLVEENSAPEGNVYSRFMMDVVGNATVYPKRDLPELTKKVTSPNANTAGTANSASIGDTVSFELNSDMPDMTGYVKYYYVINDTLAEGLTFDPASVVVRIGDDTSDPLTLGTDYEVQTGTAADGNTFQIVFKNFINRTEAKDTPIKVTYNAVLNENADCTKTGNLNTANLTYSNNPNKYAVGTPPDGDEPENPNDKTVVGKTTDQQTKTYSANIQLNKVDDSDTPQKLTGAKFRIEGTGVKCVLLNGTAYEYTANASGTYYKLTDGTYTETAPTDATKAQYTGYDSETDSYAKYKLVEVDGITTSTTYDNICKEAYVDENGVLIFKGLGPGEYTITEIEAPAGYNKLTTPITIKITNIDPNFDAPDWAATKDGAAIEMDNTTAKVSFNVVNHEGNTLPSTGGMGTKLFYLVGGLLAVGSGVILVTKKRMGNTEK